MELSEAKLTLLHEHYNQTFSLIREREKQRDNLFLVMVALFGVLFLAVQYPANFQALFSEVSTPGAKLDLRAIPFAAIMSVTWTIALLFSIRYCQVSIHIERQYRYLYTIEEKLSECFGGTELFQREGRAYKQDYLLFSKWVRFFYISLLPLIVIVAICALLFVEWSVSATLLPIYHQVYDTIVASAILVSFLLYRVAPQVSKYRARRHARVSAAQATPPKEQPTSSKS
jgi:hypothetical protein